MQQRTDVLEDHGGLCAADRERPELLDELVQVLGRLLSRYDAAVRSVGQAEPDGEGEHDAHGHGLDPGGVDGDDRQAREQQADRCRQDEIASRPKEADRQSEPPPDGVEDDRPRDVTGEQAAVQGQPHPRSGVARGDQANRAGDRADLEAGRREVVDRLLR